MSKIPKQRIFPTPLPLLQSLSLQNMEEAVNLLPPSIIFQNQQATNRKMRAPVDVLTKVISPRTKNKIQL